MVWELDSLSDHAASRFRSRITLGVQKEKSMGPPPQARYSYSSGTVILEATDGSLHIRRALVPVSL